MCDGCGGTSSDSSSLGFWDHISDSTSDVDTVQVGRSLSESDMSIEHETLIQGTYDMNTL